MTDKPNNRTTGEVGEKLALKHLLRKGYQLLEKNYVSGREEIDLIMQQDETIVFVEVKSRYNALVEPEKAVNKSKQKHLANAAEEFLFQKGLIHPIRFDIVAVNFGKSEINIEHFEDAFYPLYQGPQTNRK